MPRKFWRKAGADGLLCCGIPEAYGGPGADFRYNMIVSEEIGYAVGGGSCGFALPRTSPPITSSITPARG